MGKITIQASIHAPVEKVWQYYTEPLHIMQWNHASDDWHCPKAENDLVVGGKFSSTMAAKAGSFSFDFAGSYDAIDLHKLIAYSLGDARHVEVHFDGQSEKTNMMIIFDAEQMNPEEMQKAGWQAILDNFRKHVETA